VGDGLPAGHMAVVVLTWNHCAYTLACLDSLAEQHTPHTVYVVDNASSDGTPARVAAAFPAARVLVNDENLGFAAGNNVGLTRAFADGAEYVLVLNNDTTLAPDALAALIAAARAHPEAGIISPVILFARPPHRIWFAGATLSAWSGQDRHVAYNERYEPARFPEGPIPRAAGCAMLIARACYERIGGFDPALFMFFEDVEYSLRARAAGFGVLLAPRAVIYHHVSASTGGAKTPDSVYYMLRNGVAVMERHAPLPWPRAMLRRLIMLAAMVRFLCMRPRAVRRLRDAATGFLDAWCGRLGRRARR
jgi:GT2 family glycosyltransferase